MRPVVAAMRHEGTTTVRMSCQGVPGTACGCKACGCVSRIPNRSTPAQTTRESPINRTRRGLRGRLAEGLTITLGILAAFAVDAWWDGIQESRTDEANLTSVLRELHTTAGLLDDAVRLHGITQTNAIAVLEVTATGELSMPVDSLESLVVSLWNSYVINAPTGALEAATLAGSIARLEDEDLKDLLLGWDGLIEDLLEEEVDARENATRFVMEFMKSRGAAYVFASAYRTSVSGEVVGGRRDDLPSTRHTFDWGPLLASPEFEAEVLLLLLNAQVSQDEARAFRETLADAIQRLEAVLGEGR